MKKPEKQLNLLLPIVTSHKKISEPVAVKDSVPASNTEKRYLQIRESLKTKGLLKAR